MKPLVAGDLVSIPTASAAYAKKTFTASFSFKWLPAGLVALFTDLGSIFTQLFWVVILLWFCDFAIGFLKAFHDPDDDIEWAKVFRSVLKLIVICVGVVAVHLMEQLIASSGVDTQAKLTIATLIVIGVAEAMSVLDNLCYFFPAMGAVADKIRGFLGKARNG